VKVAVAQDPDSEAKRVAREAKKERKRAKRDLKKQKKAKANPQSSPEGMTAAQEEEEEEEEDLDPITRDRIQDSFRFTLTRPNGTKAAFDAVALADYMLASGDFSDPLTRIALSEADLNRLDQVVKGTGVSERASVLGASRDKRRYKEAKSDWDAIIGLERLIGEQVCSMLELIEAVNAEDLDPEDAEEQLVGEILPEFQHNYNLLARNDSSFADQCLSQYATFLSGPPNRATGNRAGFRNFVLNMVRVVHRQHT